MSVEGRVLGLDVGSRRIGVAVSDELGITAQPLCVVKTGSGDPVMEILRLCAEREVVAVVVGLPLSLGGEDRGVSSRRARALGERVARESGLPVIYRDERFTTAAAERILVEADVKRKDRKEVVDKMAAAMILQGYLDGR